jgi:hypothetical protein
MTEAFPLCWPVGWQRTKRPTSARFSCSFAAARDGIIHEIKLMGGRSPIISTNIPLKRDGLPYAGFKQPEDKGVAVYFMYKDKQVVLACDRWDKIEHNLQAIRKTIEAMRGVERWGVSEMLERAFSGFIALPETATEITQSTCYDILEVNKDATLGEIIAAYRHLAKKYHPDNQSTGDEEKFKRLKSAYDEAIQFR